MGERASSWQTGELQLISVFLIDFFFKGSKLLPDLDAGRWVRRGLRSQEMRYAGCLPGVRVINLTGLPRAEGWPGTWIGSAEIQQVLDKPGHSGPTRLIPSCCEETRFLQGLKYRVGCLMGTRNEKSLENGAIS